MCLVFASSCGIKTYKPSKELQAGNEKAFVEIDGSKTRDKGHASLQIFEFQGCEKKPKDQFKFMGEIKVSGNDSKKPTAIRTGIKTGVTYIKETYNWFTKVTKIKAVRTYFVPKAGDTYVYQYDESDKDLTDIKVFVERDGKKIEFEGLDDDYSKACEDPKKKKKK